MSPITDKKQEIIMTRRGAPKKLSEELSVLVAEGLRKVYRRKLSVFLMVHPYCSE